MIVARLHERQQSLARDHRALLALPMVEPAEAELLAHAASTIDAADAYLTLLEQRLRRSR